MLELFVVAAAPTQGEEAIYGALAPLLEKSLISKVVPTLVLSDSIKFVVVFVFDGQ